MTDLFRLLFQIFMIYVAFWSMRNIHFTPDDNRYPNQLATLRVLIAIALGYLVSTFFIGAALLILGQ
ncbi:MAG: DUF1146 domain-containing protein [Lactobacillaceae bacterium]|nr:DUF1146 domain-containing protein [Lactobacillaceae bacterium]